MPPSNGFIKNSFADCSKSTWTATLSSLRALFEGCSYTKIVRRFYPIISLSFSKSIPNMTVVLVLAHPQFIPSTAVSLSFTASSHVTKSERLFHLYRHSFFTSSRCYLIFARHIWGSWQHSQTPCLIHPFHNEKLTDRDFPPINVFCCWKDHHRLLH